MTSKSHRGALSTVGALGRGPTYMRVSTPANLDLALEGLVRKVLREQPKQEDIYAFAAEYFETLVEIRDKADQPNAQAADICPGRTEAEASQLIKLATSFARPVYYSATNSATRNEEELCTVVDADHFVGNTAENLQKEHDTQENTAEMGQAEEDTEAEERGAAEEPIEGDKDAKEEDRSEKQSEMAEKQEDESVEITEVPIDEKTEDESQEMNEEPGVVTEAEDEVKEDDDESVVPEQSSGVAEIISEAGEIEEVSVQEINETNADPNEEVDTTVVEGSKSDGEETVPAEEEGEEKVPDDNEDVILEKTETENDEELPEKDLTETVAEETTTNKESEVLPEETQEEETTEEKKEGEASKAEDAAVDKDNTEVTEESTEEREECTELITHEKSDAEDSHTRDEISDATEKLLLSEKGELKSKTEEEQAAVDEVEKDIIKEFIDKEKEFATLGNCTKNLEVAEVYGKANVDDESIASVLLSQEEAAEEAELVQEVGDDGKIGEKEEEKIDTQDGGVEVEADVEGGPEGPEVAESVVEEVADKEETIAVNLEASEVPSETLQEQVEETEQKMSEEIINQDETDDNNGVVKSENTPGDENIDQTNDSEDLSAENSNLRLADAEVPEEQPSEAVTTLTTETETTHVEEPQETGEREASAEDGKGIEWGGVASVGAVAAIGTSAMAATKLLTSEESDEPEVGEESAAAEKRNNEKTENGGDGDHQQSSRKKREISGDFPSEMGENTAESAQEENSEIKPSDEDEAVLEAIFSHSAEGTNPPDEKSVLESKEGMVDGFISAFAEEHPISKELEPEVAPEADEGRQSAESTESNKAENSDNVGEDGNQETELPTEKDEEQSNEDVVSEKPQTDETEKAHEEENNSEVTEEKEQPKSDEILINRADEESKGGEISEKTKPDTEEEVIKEEKQQDESEITEDAKSEKEDTDTQLDVEIKGDELIPEAETALTSDEDTIKEEAKAAVNTVIEEATQRLGTPEGLQEDTKEKPTEPVTSETPDVEDREVVTADNRQKSVDDDTEVVVGTTDKVMMGEDETKTEPGETSENQEEELVTEVHEQMAATEKVSSDSSDSSEENPFISAEVKKLETAPSAVPSLDMQEAEDESDVIVPLNADIGTIEELDEDVWSSQLSAIRAAMIIQKNYRRYLQKRKKAAKNGDIDRISGRDFSTTKDYSSTESTSSATKEQHNENKLERLDTAIENTKNKDDATIKSPRERLMDFSNANKTIDDSDVWGTIEKELDTAAITIQHGYKGYKERQRERLRREDAVQLTSQESSVADSPKAKASRLLGTGEMHDMIVPEEAQL